MKNSIDFPQDQKLHDLNMDLINIGCVQAMIEQHFRVQDSCVIGHRIFKTINSNGPKSHLKHQDIIDFLNQLKSRMCREIK